MSLEERILADLTTAMKAKEADRIAVLRSLKSKLQEKEISLRQGERKALTDEQALEVVMKAAKQRKESIEQFTSGGREDLVAQEEKELKIIEGYLPEMMSEEDVRKVVSETLSELGISDPSGMGRAMGALMGKLKGKADPTLISSVVKDTLSGK